MNLLEVHLVSGDLSAQRVFYGEVLGLPVSERSEGRLAVQVGRTRLSFTATARQAGPYHLAFDVPEDRFTDAADWIRGRATLLSEGNQDTFVSQDWNAEMLYFTDPCGNILELIARHSLSVPEIETPPRERLSVSSAARQRGGGGGHRRTGYARPPAAHPGRRTVPGRLGHLQCRRNP